MLQKSREYCNEMNTSPRLCFAVLTLMFLYALQECTSYQNDDKQYHLVSEAYNVAKSLFMQGRENFDVLKNNSLASIDTFLSLVETMNREMARELRSAIVKFYKIKYFHDFTNYVISMEEIIDITEHCLLEPSSKLEQIRRQFHQVIDNFQDVRNFRSVDKCRHQLPDEVAAAHCMLHQAVLFNETMAENLVSIVKIKTRQHASEVNSTLYDVQRCFNDFVPKFFEQLLIDAYTDGCGYLKIINASVADLANDKWKNNETVFPKKWGPLVKVLEEKLKPPKQMFDEPLFLTLFTANLSSQDVISTLYSV